MAEAKVNETNAAPLQAWQASSVRVTAFQSQPITAEQTWWADLVGYPPETLVSRPKAGEYLAAGEFEGRLLSLEVRPDRLDWTLAPVVKAEAGEPSTLPLPGPFPAVLTSFMNLMSRWTPLAPSITRLAFGAVLAQPTEDRAAGYRRVSKYLPTVQIDPINSSDFLYQINRPRPSQTVPGLHINRLTRWSVMFFTRFSLSAERTGIRTVSVPLGESSVRLELDVNTAPDYQGAFPADKLQPLLKELVEFASEIAAHGDSV